ncbi:MAG: helix-turn-helix domain-containing protein [Balneolales bacterium]|nr:helix-turn-helix domain-containing protein [Balneolales bacterium]
MEKDRIHESTLGLAKADSVLRENIAQIGTVAEWAEVVGYADPKSFARKYRNKFDRRAKEAIIKTKLDVAISLLKNKPDLSCYEIARKIGKEDEKALNYFFYTHLRRPPREYRSKD